ncbi:Lpg1974 family pore-forming outer membrane protein [Legionella lytica]|uniref:Lpg1974 family pore-forming outer membrane protein n=1 Tax=Legionella lytica TaxID=96232 RepID=A0ABW8D3Y6_9GAMM
MLTDLEAKPGINYSHMANKGSLALDIGYMWELFQCSTA